MKKFRILSVILAVLTAFAAGFGCKVTDKGNGDNGETGRTALQFYCPDGAPALAAAGLFGNETLGTDDITMNYHVISADKIASTVLKTTKKADVAILPVNAAAKICGTGEDYVLTSVLTHGNLFIVSDTEITINDLVGKVVGVIGRGLVPDMTLKAVLTKNNIEYVEANTAESGKVALTYYESGEELMPAMKQNKIKIGLLPEPAATKIVTKLKTAYTYRLDLGELYEGGYPQAVMLVKKSVMEAHPDFYGKLTAALQTSVTWVNTVENASAAVDAVNAKLDEGVVGTLDTFVTAEVIGRCSVKYASASSMKTKIKDYLSAIGQNLPSDAFFYGE